MKFQDWVAAFGSPERLAIELGVTSWSVRNWITGRCYPKTRNMLKIVKLSKGALTVESILRDTMPANSKKK